MKLKHGPRPRTRSRAVAAGLRHYRLAAGLSGREAAERSGYCHATIYAWETGKNAPSFFDIRVLAEVYGVTEAAILGYYPRREYRAERVGPWETGRACESGWWFEEVTG